ncbi:glycoside hydrolase [Bacteroides eggerthii]|jgi:endo-1,4-beta-D-glucanase Y|uniref:glycosyl hydrolase family 8 n=1 Tax=Bacteroides eggerthii TaxID=28111 RepID=UPI0015B87F6D|nr:glycosyl hydrolase family 8 [Bacteroides eggerthii]MBV3842292.1 glycoside hydrolase [Bacteroides eggerthii]MBV3845211.1 glycoside hydrolase [Bacteroides eggerthii]MBV3883389.1 glycoside hydrolase [Bacteroides eggerthii]MBV3890333.1 glycoside hydrolase [Bacteroides eggerthii]MBV3901497.1 glycoside hydrolase [Bacteroides eggerthii]
MANTKKTRITLVALLLSQMTTFGQTAIPLVYDKECANDNFRVPEMPAIDKLPEITTLPDPFAWADGSGRSTDFKDWERHRFEIARQLQHYELGMKPVVSKDSIEATLINDTLRVVVHENGETLLLTAPIKYPEGNGPFPAIIGIGRPTGSLPVQLFDKRRIAQITFNFTQVMSHTQKRGNEPINRLYPDQTDMGAYCAWPWGISRLIDGLEKVGKKSRIDLSHLAVSGCSFAGKMALFAGAFDERIALTIAQEPGGGGVDAWRVSETLGNVETLGRTSYAWFLESMRQFAGKNVNRLPIDHHELAALIAPRALLVLGNTDYEWLAEESNYVSCQAARMVWKAFGIEDRMGFSIQGGHMHCMLPESQYPEVEAFIDKFLLGKTDVDTFVSKADMFEDVDYLKWMPWANEIERLGEERLPYTKGAFATRRYRNLFAELGYKQKDIDKKLKSVFESVFYGPDKVYFEVGDSMAYISDIKNHDVRTEGMSYGLMIAVQFDRKDIFDRLWRWGKKYMQHQEGPLKGYFAWSCKTDGTRNAQGPASDGELYYVTSLIFASNRWGNSTGINYLAEAQNILDCSMQKIGMERVAPLINLEHQLITFTPDPFGGRFTDPSYHVPAFYEVWARWAEDGRSEFWRACARKSREYLHKSIHPVTGLNPDYNNYDGTLLGSKRVIGDAFRFDSWRVPMNIALDYSWACADRKWQQEYGNKIQNFFYSQGIDSFVDQYNVDGTTVTELLGAGGYKKLRHSLGLVATTAAVSLVCTHDKSREFVDRLWNVKHVPYDDGYFDAYYDGLLRLFAFMHLSGNYRIIFPQGH